MIPNNITLVHVVLTSFLQDEPKWIPYNRSADTDVNSYRLEYVRSITVN